MRYKVLVIPILLLTLCILLFPIKGLAENSGQTVYVISLKDEITPAMSAYLVDRIEQANLSKAEGIIIDISTLGGRVDSALAMRDAIVSSEIPVAVYVGDRAESAGALITIAANTIIMAPGSHMGAAEPIPYSEKTAAFVTGEFRTTAELRGRDPLVAAGMVDKDLEVPGFPKGKLVDISALQAQEFGYADAVLSTMPEVLEHMGWDEAQVLEVEPDYKIQMAQFLTKYEIASILLTIGMIAMIIEIFVQGFGLPGLIGIIAFALYFGGGFLAGNTELWSLALFIIGIVLMLIELAVPGFGVFGVSGIITIIISIIFTAPDPIQGAKSLGIAFLATIIIIPVLYKFLGGSKVFNRLVLAETGTADKGYSNFNVNVSNYLLGKTGEAVTPLRPAGMILVDGKKFDAVSDGTFLQLGSKVKIIQVEGTRIVVTAIEG